jgi:hypothetical protein
MFKQNLLKKEYLLVAATLVLLLISYQLAFKKTAEAWQLNNHLKTQLAQSTDVSYQPQYAERKNNNLGKLINLYKADTANFRSNVISIISSVAEKENVKLSEVPSQDLLYHTAQFIIQKLNFEGDYFSLIKVLNRLQSTKEIGMVRAVNFKTIAIPSNADKGKKLVLEVYMEIAQD